MTHTHPNLSADQESHQPRSGYNDFGNAQYTPGEHVRGPGPVQRDLQITGNFASGEDYKDQQQQLQIQQALVKSHQDSQNEVMDELQSSLVEQSHL